MQWETSLLSLNALAFQFLIKTPSGLYFLVKLPSSSSWWMLTSYKSALFLLQFHMTLVEMPSNKSFAHGNNLPWADTNLLVNLWYAASRTAHLGKHTRFPQNIFCMFNGWEKKKRGRKVSWVRFVYRLNFLMTFSLKVPAAKYCLLLPLELSALIMRGSTWKLFT